VFEFGERRSADVNALVAESLNLAFSFRLDDAGREDFPFDRARNVYICPAGKVLTTANYRTNLVCALRAAV
jgi:hypothetical protein